MRVKINIDGQTKDGKAVRGVIDKLTAQHFTQYKMQWEEFSEPEVVK